MTCAAEYTISSPELSLELQFNPLSTEKYLDISQYPK